MVNNYLRNKLSLVGATSAYAESTTAYANAAAAYADAAADYADATAIYADAAAAYAQTMKIKPNLLDLSLQALRVYCKIEVRNWNTNEKLESDSKREY